MRYLLILFYLNLHGQIDSDTKHFYATTFIYQATNRIVLVKTENNFKSNASAILTSGLISILGKEYIYDKWMGKGVFSKQDIFIDSWAIACNLTVSIPLNALYISNQEEKRELKQIKDIYE